MVAHTLHELTRCDSRLHIQSLTFSDMQPTIGHRVLQVRVCVDTQFVVHCRKLTHWWGFGWINGRSLKTEQNDNMEMKGRKEATALLWYKSNGTFQSFDQNGHDLVQPSHHHNHLDAVGPGTTCTIAFTFIKSIHFPALSLVSSDTDMTFRSKVKVKVKLTSPRLISQLTSTVIGSGLPPWSSSSHLVSSATLSQPEPVSTVDQYPLPTSLTSLASSGWSLIWSASKTITLNSFPTVTAWGKYH